MSGKDGLTPTFPAMRAGSGIVDLDLYGLTLVRRIELGAMLQRLDELEATVRAQSLALLSLKGIAKVRDATDSRRLATLREFAIGLGIAADGEDLVEIALAVSATALARLDIFRGLPRHPSKVTPGGPGEGGAAPRAATDEGAT